MQKNAYGELKRNTLLIAVSNLGSRAISFILAPLYSYYLTTSEYGTMDLITTTASLLVPFICFGIYEGIFRFASDEKYDKATVFSSSFSVCAISTLAVSILVVLAYLFFRIPNSVILCLIAAICNSFLNLFTQYARGKGKMLIFTFSGIFHSIILLLGNVLLMILLRYGLTGWMISYVAAQIITIIYLCLRLKIWNEFSFKCIDKNIISEMMKYCLPLIPSASMWWIMNASDRYVILLYYSTAMAGIYAVANKLPAILSVFETVFYQAWQTTAINTLDEKGRDIFYSSIFSKYLELMTAGVLALLVVLKPLMLKLFATDYSDAWTAAGILVVGVMIHALTGNLGTLYTVFKDTKGALKTSFIGAITNIVLNLVFVKYWGFVAAACTTFFGYCVVLAVRWYDSRKYVTLSVSAKTIITSVMLVAIQLFLYFVPGIASFAAKAVIAIIYLWSKRTLLMNLLKRRV